MPNGRHTHKTPQDMDIATMCDFIYDKHDLTYWKYVLNFC